MPIETNCQGCGRQLRVADDFAGRKARCPECQTVYTVPGAATPLSNQWHLRTEDGSAYGPVAKAEMDSWVGEGRVTAECFLRRDGTDEWRRASECYPALASPSPAGTPFADQTVPTHPTSAPFTRPPFSSRGPRRNLRPHRGGTILALGICGLLCCQILAPFAWGMGQSDLRAMDAGRMNTGGRSLTQVGMVLGIIGTIILILYVTGNFLAIIGSIF